MTDELTPGAPVDSPLPPKPVYRISFGKQERNCYGEERITWFAVCGLEIECRRSLEKLAASLLRMPNVMSVKIDEGRIDYMGNVAWPTN